MQKIIKINNKVIIILSNGNTFEREDLSEEDFEKLKIAKTDEDVLEIIDPSYKEIKEENSKISSTIETINKSNILTFKNDCIYWESISQLSLPKELAEAIIKAEEEKNELLLETYKNFWTLMSLNPDEQCRKNLYWFLQRNGLVLSKCGFFVAYRNVSTTEIPNVYTDNHTHTFKITIGNMVVMERKDCDCNSNVQCSRGLHLGNKHFVKKNLFGNMGLVCLCNPADVVAVPKVDSYGKLRTCAYLPIDKCKYDKEGNVIPYDTTNGFECEYVPKVIYEGIMGTEKDSDYKIKIKEIEGINVNSITDRLLDLARESIIQRAVV